jgi:hypothetical protein
MNWEFFKRRWRIIIKIFGWAFVTAGSICLIFALYLILYENQILDAAGYISLGAGFFAVGIALLSLKIAKESDVKMDATGNEFFRRVVSEFEDKRIRFWQHPMDFGVETTIWKCHTYLQRALNLKKSYKIDLKAQSLLFQQFELLIHWSGLPWKTRRVYGIAIDQEGKAKLKPYIIKMEEKNINVLLGMCKQFRKLDLSDEQNAKLNEITDFINNEFEKIKASKKGK